jgi:hypothetical protein
VIVSFLSDRFSIQRKEMHMSVLDDIRQAVAVSEKMDAGVKSLVTDFLQAAGPALGTLAPAVVQEVLSKFAAGDGASAAASVADALSADQVAATLASLEPEMQHEVDQRAVQVAAEKQTMAAMQNAAISVIAKLLISAL